MNSEFVYYWHDWKYFLDDDTIGFSVPGSIGIN